MPTSAGSNSGSHATAAATPSSPIRSMPTCWAGCATPWGGRAPAPTCTCVPPATAACWWAGWMMPSTSPPAATGA
ncbi:hypothetical protein G6F64_015643 [Rhizopus arrhizus]|uniref:Uncharacterized protein n=1 Tax=Rhizopus oryzae TaxID=64495 RepID=A0A9P6WRU5_RHIOR|nr:hypothetical protein G6F64_015643 [Rhizopus arrhizus]